MGQNWGEIMGYGFNSDQGSIRYVDRIDFIAISYPAHRGQGWFYYFFSFFSIKYTIPFQAGLIVVNNLKRIHGYIFQYWI